MAPLIKIPNVGCMAIMLAVFACIQASYLLVAFSYINLNREMILFCKWKKSINRRSKRIMVWTCEKNEKETTTSIKIKHFVGDSSQEIKDKKSSTELEDLREFFHRTTLSGIAQMGTRNPIKWKIFWMMVSIAGFFMSLYQSRHVIQDYFEDRTIQIIDYQSVRRVPFPSLTVCSNIRLHHSKITEDLQKELCRGSSPTSCNRASSTVENDIINNEDESVVLERLLRLQAKYDNNVRINLFYGNKSSFLIGCIWKGFDCNTSDRDEVYSFYSLLHGLCFTINVGVFEILKGAEYREFEITLDMDLMSRKLKFNDVLATYWIHTPGSAPSLFSENVGRVFPGDKVRIEFQVQNITRLESKNCQKTSDFEARKLNVYYSDELPYVYQETSCTFYKENAIGVQKGCYHAAVPYPDLENKISDPSSRFCISWMCWSNCSNLEDSIVDEIQVQCATPCVDINMRYSTNTMSLILENLVESSMLSNADDDDDDISGSIGAELRNNFHSVIQLSPANNIVEDIVEESKYSVADFLGILGGNIGLWVGVSIVSLAETIELMYLLIRLALRHCVMKQQQQVNDAPEPEYTVEVRHIPSRLNQNQHHSR